MYQGHFPPLGQSELLRPPPFAFRDRRGREIEVRVLGDGPVDDELEALVDMYLAFDASFRTLGIPPRGETRIREWLDRITADLCVIAWHGDRAVGQAVLVAGGPDEHGPPGHEVAIFVHQEYHGAGIGTALMEALLTHGREQGIEQVWLLVERDNRPAVTLYRDLGFVVSNDDGYDIEMTLSL